jgi:hypothetical protein
MNRGLFMTLTAAGLATSSWPAVSPGLAAFPGSKSRIKALAFDAFPIFDFGELTAAGTPITVGVPNANGVAIVSPRDRDWN